MRLSAYPVEGEGGYHKIPDTLFADRIFYSDSDGNAEIPVGMTRITICFGT